MRYSRLVKSLWILIFLSVWIPIATTQDSFTEFRWYEADIALRYPADWQSPTSAVINNNPTLQLSAMLPADDIPATTIVITLFQDTTATSDLYALLSEQMQALDIIAAGPLPAQFMGVAGIATNGVNADGMAYGSGRIALTDMGAIAIVGRGARERRDTFVATFDNIANSLLIGADNVIVPLEYGVLWYNDSYPDDGEDAFLDIRGMVYQANRLYVVDEFSGIFVFDAETGIILERIELLTGMQPSGIAIDNSGVLYISDLACGCIQQYSNAQWQLPLATFEFGIDAPASLIVTTDNNVYATDIDDDTYLVHRFQNDALTQSYTFEIPLNTQPILIRQSDDSVIALTDEGEIFTLEGVGFSSVAMLNARDAQFITGTMSPEGNITVTTEQQGILSFDDSGEIINRIGRIVASFPLAGELVAPSGIAFSDEGTSFWADSDGSFGAVNAVTPTVEGGRVGLTTLALGTTRQGELSDDSPEQIWTLDVQANQTTTIAVIANETSNLDVALRIIDPSGTEVAFVDNDDENILLNSLDVILEGFRFEQDGIYSFVVERVTGTGRYTLGLTATDAMPFDSETAQRVDVIGQIEDALTVQSWTFNAPANLAVTITMQATDGTLDPLLRLYDSNGTLLNENDDAENPDLVRDAQIEAFVLPSTGEYTIEATRFDGQGAYQLTLEAITSQ